jgi:hypothetical protein
MDFWTIEIADGPTWSAASWRRAYGERLVEAAVTNGAKEWSWVDRGWGVLLEVAFTDESGWLRFRGTPAVRAALDAAPDPVNGRWIYSGRGGSSGSMVPRRPRPIRGADGAPLPEPDHEPELWQHPVGLRHCGAAEPALTAAAC